MAEAVGKVSLGRIVKNFDTDLTFHFRLFDIIPSVVMIGKSADMPAMLRNALPPIDELKKQLRDRNEE